MRKFLALLSIVFILTSCDDGDVFVVELDFDDTFQACGELVFYNIKESPFESISLQISSPLTTVDDIFALTYADTDSLLVELVNPTLEGSINGTTNLLNYRSYSSTSTDLFCNDIPPSDLQITQDLSSCCGTYVIFTEYFEDDDDGIPAEMEDINGNGLLYDDDTDGDGIPNYLDTDDDGDNVLTSTELLDHDNDDDDDDPLTNPQDTDGDGIPNYLDTDDDNDGVLTRNEENINQDLNPSNDYTNPNIADYLNPMVNSSVPADAYRPNTIQQLYEVSLNVYDISFPTLNQTSFDFGYLVNSRITGTRTVTPDF